MRSATRVLVLTDLVDSTKLVSHVGDARAGALNAAVDRLSRDLLVAHDGLEIDKTDGFLMLFEEPLAALRFAAELHDRLAELSEREGVRLAMRVGLHRGEVGLRENPPEDVARGAKPLEVEGLAKPLAARVMGLAVGGQSLVTDTLPRDRVVADGLQWVDHGKWRLKGVAEPVHLWEIGRPGRSPLAPPPDSEKAWRALSGPLALQREAARKAWALRPVRAVVGAVGLAVVAVAGWQWDRTREKVSFHLAEAWTADGPVGVGEPIPGEPSVRVVRRGGQVQSLQHISPGGSPLARPAPAENSEFFGLSLLGTASEPKWAEVEGWGSGRGRWGPNTELVRGDDGALLRIELREPSGLLTAQASVEQTDEGLRLRWQTPYGAVGLSPGGLVSVESLSFDEAGLLAEKRYYDASGLVPASDLSGTFGLRVERDELGRPVERTWLDRAGNPTGDRVGSAIERRSYHGDSWHEHEVAHFDPGGGSVMPSGGCARWVRSADGLETWCFGIGGAKAATDLHPIRALRCHHTAAALSGTERRTTCTDVDGAIRGVEVRRFDERGHPSETRIETADGQLLAGRSGWAVERYSYDPSGRMLMSPLHTDVHGAPMIALDAGASDGTGIEGLARWSYDPDGRLLERTTVDARGNPLARGGFATVRLVRDAGGRATEALLYDAEGQPTTTVFGVHRQVNSLDGQGRTVEIARFGLSGEPAADGQGAHRDVMRWDDLARLVEVAWFDAEGPTERSDSSRLKSSGSHRIGISYDDRSNVARLDFYDADGGRGKNRKGRAATTFEWDEMGREMGSAFWGPDGEPVVHAERGFHRVRIRTHPTIGYLSTDLTVWGAGGEPALAPDGCHSWQGDFDVPGAVLDEVCLDVDGQRIVNRLGYSRARYMADDLGRPTGVAYLGLEDEPVASHEGLSTIEMHYTPQGYLERYVQRGLDGSLVHIDQRRPARWSFGHDDLGRLVSFLQEDERGPTGVGLVEVARDDQGRPTLWHWVDHGRRLAIERDGAGRPAKLAWTNSDGGAILGPPGWSVAEVQRSAGQVTVTYRRVDGSPARLGGYSGWRGDEPVYTAYQDGQVPGVVDLMQPHFNAWIRFGELQLDHFEEVEGLAAWSGTVLDFDDAGQLTQRTYVDGEGAPVVPTDPGFAIARFDSAPEGFDNRAYFGPDGAPMAVCGVASVSLEAGRPVARDLTGAPVEVPEACRDRRVQVRRRSPAAP